MSEQQGTQGPANVPGRRTFMPWWGVLGWVLVGLVVLTWLVDGASGLSTRGLVLLAVGAVTGLAGVVAWAARTRRA